MWKKEKEKERQFYLLFMFFICYEEDSALAIYTNTIRLTIMLISSFTKKKKRRKDDGLIKVTTLPNKQVYKAYTYG